MSNLPASVPLTRRTSIIWITPSDDIAVATEPLRIDGTDVRFLREALLDGSRFERLIPTASDEREFWRLRFFLGTRFVTSIVVVRNPALEAASANTREDGYDVIGTWFAKADVKPSLLKLARSIWVNLSANDSKADAALQMVSQFLRGSMTMRRADFSERSGRLLAVEPHGLGLIAQGDYVEDIHARHTLLLALVRAYQQAAESASSALSRLVAQPDAKARAELEALHRDVLIFTARYLFARPVKLETTDLRHVWDDLSEIAHLQASHQELSEQLTSVLELLRHEAQTRLSDTELRSQKRLTFFGLALTVLSLLSLLTVTPDTIRAFFQAWFRN